MNDRVLIDYSNHAGIRAMRLVVPKSLFYGLSVFHAEPEKQWFMTAFCVERGSDRTFALKDVHSWTPALDPVAAEA